VCVFECVRHTLYNYVLVICIQFIIHRGLIISFIQAVFSAIYFMAAIAVYTGWLMVGYSTWYTMAPVFALVLDEDVKKSDAFTFPELYKELQKGRALNIKTFFLWTLLSVYQAAVIMVLSILLFESRLMNIVSITFTALILSELLNVAFTIRTWNLLIVLAEIVTFALYFVSMLLLPSYFGMQQSKNTRAARTYSPMHTCAWLIDLQFISTFDFWWRVVAVTMASCVPVYMVKIIHRKLNPPAWTKLRG
jgi:phospholipid-translocating ATPase